MKKEILTSSLLILATCSAVSAEEMKSEVTREQKEVEVDAQTGQVHQQQQTQKETLKKETANGQTRIEKGHESSGSVSSESVHGDRDAVHSTDTTKTAVTTRPEGTLIEQKQQHTEKVLSD